MISNRIKALEIATNIFLNEKTPFPGDEGMWSEDWKKNIFWKERNFAQFLELANGLENFLNTGLQNIPQDN